jgi:hypothetical protein
MSAGETMLRSRRGHWKTVFATNSTDTSFTATNETATEPAETTAGVIKVDPLCSGYVSTQIKVLPFGTNAANETFNGRIIAWHRNAEENTWIPTELVTFAVTLGAAVALKDATALQTFADTIAYTSGIAEADLQIVSPADDTRAWLLVDIMGAEYLQFQVDLVLAASGNYYYHTL